MQALYRGDVGSTYLLMEAGDLTNHARGTILALARIAEGVVAEGEEAVARPTVRPIAVSPGLGWY